MLDTDPAEEEHSLLSMPQPQTLKQEEEEARLASVPAARSPYA